MSNLKVNTITEQTLNNGVNIQGAIFKPGVIFDSGTANMYVNLDTSSVSPAYTGLQVMQSGVVKWELVKNLSHDFVIFDAAAALHRLEIITGAPGVTNIRNTRLYVTQTDVQNSSPDGTVHIFSGSAGTISPSANGDELVIEGSGNTGISILRPTANDSYIYFGDPTNTNVAGKIAYVSSNEFVFGTAQVERFKIGAGYLGMPGGTLFYTWDGGLIELRATYLMFNSVKTSSGDPVGLDYNGMFVINTADHNIKIYAGGAYRTLASW